MWIICGPIRIVVVPYRTVEVSYTDTYIDKQTYALNPDIHTDKQTESQTDLQEDIHTYRDWAVKL